MENKKSIWKILKPCLEIELLALGFIFVLSNILFKITRENAYNTVEERYTSLYGAWGYSPDISRFMEEKRMLGRTESGAGAIILGMNNYYKAALGPENNFFRENYLQETEDYEGCVRVKVQGSLTDYTDGHEENFKLDGTVAFLSFVMTEQTKENGAPETAGKEYAWDLSRYLSKQDFEDLVSLAADDGEIYVLKLWGYRDADGIVPTGVRVKARYNDYPRDIQFDKTTENTTLLYEKDGKDNSKANHAGIYICRQAEEWKEPSYDSENNFKTVFSKEYHYRYFYKTLPDGKESSLSVEKDDTALNSGKTESGRIIYEVLVDVNLVAKRKASRKILLLALWGQLAAFITMLYYCAIKRKGCVSKVLNSAKQFRWRNFVLAMSVGFLFNTAFKISADFLRGEAITYDWVYYIIFFSLGYLFCLIALIILLKEEKKIKTNPTES